MLPRWFARMFTGPSPDPGHMSLILQTSGLSSCFQVSPHLTCFTEEQVFLCLDLPRKSDLHIPSNNVCKLHGECFFLGKISAISGHVPKRERTGGGLQMHHGSFYQVSVTCRNWQFLFVTPLKPVDKKSFCAL